MRAPMANNPMNLMGGFQNFMRDPSQVLSRMGVPQGMKNPDQIVQFLMDNGKISQAQYNQAKQAAEQMRHNPMFQNMFK